MYCKRKNKRRRERNKKVGPTGKKAFQEARSDQLY